MLFSVVLLLLISHRIATLSMIARFMGPTWGPSGADGTQVGPMLAPWTLLSGFMYTIYINTFYLIIYVILSLSSTELSTIIDPVNSLVLQLNHMGALYSAVLSNQTSRIRRTIYKNWSVSRIVLQLSCAIFWSQVLSRDWRCSRTSADRRWSNYIWVINNCIAYY